jgi:hypothetical protein
VYKVISANRDIFPSSFLMWVKLLLRTKSNKKGNSLIAHFRGIPLSSSVESFLFIYYIIYVYSFYKHFIERFCHEIVLNSG